MIERLLLLKFDFLRVRDKKMQKCNVGASLQSAMGLFSSSDGALKGGVSLLGSLETAARAQDEVKGRGHKLRGNGPAVSLKDDNSPPRPRAEPGYANEPSAGWPAPEGAARDWRPAVGEGLGVEDSWDPASREQADKRGRKRAREGRVRERKTGSQTS